MHVGLLRPFHNLRDSRAAKILRLTTSEWLNDRAPRLGASLAFYTALSLAPLLVIVLAIAGLVYGHKAAQGQLVWTFGDTIGPDGARAIQTLLSHAYHPVSGVLATTVGLIVIMFTASSVMVELNDALNTIWHVPVPEESGLTSIMRVVHMRLRSLLMVLSVGLLLIVTLAVSAWLSAAGKFFSEYLPVPGGVLEISNLSLSLIVTAILFAILYKSIPSVTLQWGDVAVGAAFTAVLFTLGKFLIGLYLGRTAIASTYGAAGSFFVTLLWVYYSAQIFFFGAEFTKVYTQHYGSQFRRKLELHPSREVTPPLVVDGCETAGNGVLKTGSVSAAVVTEAAAGSERGDLVSANGEPWKER